MQVRLAIPQARHRHRKPHHQLPVIGSQHLPARLVRQHERHVRLRLQIALAPHLAFNSHAHHPRASVFPLRDSLLCELCALCDLCVSFFFSFNFQPSTLNSLPFASSAPPMIVIPPALSGVGGTAAARIPTPPQNCHSDRSGPTFSFAPPYGASGRAVEESAFLAPFCEPQHLNVLFSLCPRCSYLCERRLPRSAPSISGTWSGCYRPSSPLSSNFYFLISIF